MGTTSIYGWRIPDLNSGQPNGPQNFADLATDVEATLNTARVGSLPLFVGWQASGTAQSIPNGAFTALVIDQEDVDSPAAHSTSTNPSRYTATVAGWYRWTACAGFTLGSGRVGITYGVNGTAVTARAAFTPAPGSSAFVTAFLARHVHLAVGDYLESFAWQSSGGSLPVANVSVDIAFVRP